MNTKAIQDLIEVISDINMIVIEESEDIFIGAETISIHPITKYDIQVFIGQYRVTEDFISLYEELEYNKSKLYNYLYDMYKQSFSSLEKVIKRIHYENI